MSEPVFEAIDNPQEILKNSPKFMQKMQEWGIDIDKLDIFELEDVIKRYEKENK